MSLRLVVVFNKNAHKIDVQHFLPPSFVQDTSIIADNVKATVCVFGLDESICNHQGVTFSILGRLLRYVLNK